MKRRPGQARTNSGRNIRLAGAPIVLPHGADDLTRLAARELARYQYLLTGQESALRQQMPRHGNAILLDRQQAGSLGTEGFTIQTHPRGKATTVAIVAPTSRGLLHGVYTLLEELGVGFYLGGDTLPEVRNPTSLPLGFHQTQQPVFATRGILLHDNLLVGTTAWGLSDYQFHLNQLAHMRCNTFVLAHYSDAAAEIWDAIPNAIGSSTSATPAVSGRRSASLGSLTSRMTC